MRVLMRQTRLQEDVTGARLLLADREYDIADVIALQWIRDGRAIEVVGELVAVKAFSGAPENKAGRRRKAEEC
jgi:hypothetical protein